MSPRLLPWSLAVALAACGGAASVDGARTGTQATRLLATAVAVANDGQLVLFPGLRSRYAISAAGNGFAVTDLETGSATSVTAAQRLQFADVDVALDTAGIPAQAYRLYQAAFNRTPDSAGLGFWISVLDDGASLSSVAGGFVVSDEFKALVGANATNEQLLTAIYTNVLHRTPDGAGYQWWLNQLNTRATDAAGALLGFSESDENKANVAAAIATGITYTPMTRAAGNTVPGAPTLGAVTGGNGTASLAFTKPSSDGGSAITGYSATCSGNGVSKTASGGASPLVVSGLTNGTQYACTVKAANGLGSGADSNAISVTPGSGSAATAPGAPAIGTATAGNGSASIAFSAPASNGGAAITSYTATCSAGGASKSGSGSGSPISVSGLTNGTTYTCSVTATNAAGTSAASSTVSVTPAAGSTSTSLTGHLYCGYSASVQNPTISLTSTVATSCTSSQRTMTGNGVPDHEVGAFPNSGNPNTIAAVTVNFSNTLNPAVSSTTGTSVAHVIGYANNGVKFDPATAESYQNAGVWKIEALNQTYFAFGVDSSNAHVQPDGAYHYHGMPEKYLSKLGKGQAMTLVGFAVDGFPIYARYGYTTATDAASALKVMKPSYRLKTSPSAGRPSTSSVPMGTFTQDYEYVQGLGDLDECNGRTGVTPEFPSGIYHYYITDDYPYIQRCVKGTAPAQMGP